VGPDYEKAPVPLSDHWRFQEKDAEDTANLSWWELFNDPMLTRLIESGIRSNLDMQIATANVETYMGKYGTARGRLFPIVYGDGNYHWGRKSDSELGLTKVLFPDYPNEERSARLESFLWWELDVWGMLRRIKEASYAEYEANVAAQKATILFVVSEIARNYVKLRTYDKELDITKGIIGTLEDQLRIAKARLDIGHTSMLEYQQVESEYHRRLALIPKVESEIAVTEHAIKLLLGQMPSTVIRGKTLDELTMPPVPKGLPSDLLERRPDIIEAEQQLIAATAGIGVARGEYFPRVTIFSDVGSVASDMETFATPGANFYGITQRVFGPIINFGRIAGKVQTAEATERAAFASYQKTILAAYKQFEDALIVRRKTGEERAEQSKRVDAVAEYYRLASLRYDEGYTDFITVLDSLRQLYDARYDLAAVQGLQMQASIDLYLAMGGGWLESTLQSGYIVKPKDAQILP
jgi:multidrug efflux system outer membrane protein